MRFDFSNLFGQANSEPTTEAQGRDGKATEAIGEDADELKKALKSVTGLGESASKVWGKLFDRDQALKRCHLLRSLSFDILPQPA